VATINDLLKRGIIPISWLAFSLNLNSIKKIWNWIKDWIEREYGEQKWTHLKLRKAIKATWDTITVN